MSAIVIDNVWKEYGDQIVLERHLARPSQRPRLRRARRPVRLRQDHVPALLLGAGAPTPGTILLDGKPLAARAGPRSRRGVPALFGVSASDRARQCAARQGVRRPRASGRGCSARPAARPSRRRAALIAEVGLAGCRGQISRAALRRHAAAPRARAGADHAAARAAARRAVRRARSRHPRRHPRADEAALERDRPHRRHGHPRHARGLHARHPRHRLRAPARPARTSASATAPRSAERHRHLAAARRRRPRS